MKLLSLFSGIGAFEKALTRQNITFELVGYSDIDKWASKAYSIIHNVPGHFNLGDITKIDAKTLPDFDLMTYGFPCQDISVAGRQKGINKDTRSGLLYDALRILKEKKPKYAIAENVKNLVSKKFKQDFFFLLQELESYGYKNYYKILNARDFGIPQNRERVFIISIRNDIDETFEFPEPFDNGIRLKDLLESEVDEKYYISEEKTLKIINSSFKQEAALIQNPNNICSTLLARDFKDPKCIPCLTPDRIEKRQNGRRFKNDGDPIFTLTSQDRHGVLTKVGCIGSDSQGNRVYDTHGIASTQCGNGGGLGAKTGLYLDNLRIRKLIPLECFRLMGFDDSDFYKIKNVGISDTQLYKMAGNSIVVNVLEEIFKKVVETWQR